MKNLIFFLVFTVFFEVCAVNAQENNYYPLVQEGKVWSVVNRQGQMPWEWKYTTTQMAFFGDTTINDVLYKKMYASTKEFPEFPQDWKIQNFMREDENKKVWYKRNASSKEELYYDFSLDIGDTLPDNLGYVTPLSHIVFVKNITYEKMHNGEERKVWHLSITEYGDVEELWFEGIGSEYGIIFPISFLLVGELNSLLCVHINGELIFNDNPYGTCYKSGWPGGISSYDKQINIFPNPAKDILYIDSADKINIINISLINIYGQTIKQSEAKTGQINVSDIPSGLYFIKLTTHREEIIQKIVINK
jgi:hypothetical protein